jgi:GAF domain-containing protein
MEKLAQSGGGTIYVSVKILFARRRSNHPHKKASLALAILFTPRCAERTSERARHLRSRSAGTPVAKNQPLVVTGITHDPRFAGSPVLKQHRFRFYAGVPVPGPNASGIQSGLLP